MPTRILLIGGGGREHALAWKLATEPGINRVIAAPGSEAIATEPRVHRAAAVDASDGAALVALARREAAELAVIGPEAPLAAGVADALRAAGVPTFGPSRAATRIESSKAFCREVAGAAGVPMARGAAFSALEPALEAAAGLATRGGIVVKADGLASGKGVTVCEDLAEAEAALRDIFAEPRADDAHPTTGSPRVIVEERLVGREASLIALCDGRDAVALPAARDHKRLLDGDRGPNTGGMGAYSPLQDIPDGLARQVVETVHYPLLAELARRGTPFTGALYAGLMLTDDGPVLLECNARFGDPETQVILPRLLLPLGPLLLAAARGRLASALGALGIADRLLPASSSATVGVVLAGRRYPTVAAQGDAIAGLAEATSLGGLVFHAGTRRAAAGGYETNGGRVLTVVGRGPDMASARAAAERAADAISFAGAQRRRDIAADLPAAVVPERVPA
ncbi:MAG TPA: phosphoribosylamine--glycine ligase [Candidatus Limnocylindria bacterium]|nr:phosphoribosylamine--glycine ligase [Candidatus Limnocylindria bacterium]